MRQTSQKKHGGNVWDAQKRSGREIGEILDYSANISPLGTPKSVKKAIVAALDQLIHYPDPDSWVLRERLATQLGVGKEQIIVGNGSVELIYLLAKTLKPQKTLLLHPTFSEYEFAIQSEGGALEILALQAEDSFHLCAETVLAKLDAVDLLVICNPNNPTGCLTKREVLMRILDQAAEKNVFVIIDEAFMDFVACPEAYSVLTEVLRRENLFVLRSLTKFYALPGLRIGCGFGSETLLEKMNGLREPWTVNRLAQAAAQEALLDVAYGDAVKQVIWQEKEYLYQELQKIKGIHPYPPSVNYVFMDISQTGQTATALTAAMEKAGVLVRNCHTYPFLGEKYLRVAVRTRSENDILLQTLKKML